MGKTEGLFIAATALKVGSRVFRHPVEDFTLHHLVMAGREVPTGKKVEGFLTSDGDFVERLEARQIGMASGQISAKSASEQANYGLPCVSEQFEGFRLPKGVG